MKLNKEEKTTIEVERVWFETLAKLADEVQRELDAYIVNIEELPLTSIYRLIGYASSAETLLKIKQKDEKLRF